MIGLDETINYLKSTIRHITLDKAYSSEHYFKQEARLIELEKVLVTLKAVHLSVELECPKFRRMFSADMEKDDFIADKFDLQTYILKAQQIDKDAADAFQEHAEEYGKWLASAGGVFSDELSKSFDTVEDLMNDLNDIGPDKENDDDK